MRSSRGSVILRLMPHRAWQRHPRSLRDRAVLQLRSSSSSSISAFLESLTPESIKSSVKSALLEEAAREDSRIWQQKPATSQQRQHQQQHVNGHQNQHNHEAPIRQQQGKYQTQQHQNGLHQTQQVNGGLNETTVRQNMLDPSAALDDPLDDLYASEPRTRYWPELPPGVSALDADPFVLAKAELDTLSQSIRQDLIGSEHPVLNKAASYFFESTAEGGKKVRPMMVLLLSRALAETTGGSNNQQLPLSTQQEEQQLLTRPQSWQRSDLPAAQRRLAEISEMIHTASLFHDDVIDKADTRRGVPTVHSVFGNKMAILAGDYLLARASISLARLRNVAVVETMSTIIEHLVRGEVMQMRGTSSSSHDDSQERMVYYLQKNFYKTGSLMANSCRSAALLGEYPANLVSASYRYGKHVGMAFQLVDDVLDFEGSLSSLGKPALSDLRAGLATAPVLLAAQEHADLWTLMDRKFGEEGDVERAVEFVTSTTALERTKDLARVHAERAMDAVLEELAPSPHRDALVLLANKVVARTK